MGRSTTVTPTFRYKGGDADGTDWAPWTYGETLDWVSSGTNISFNQGSPLLGSNDDSVCFRRGDHYHAQNTSFGDIATEDIVLEIVFRKEAGTARRFFSNIITTSAGYDLLDGGANIRFSIDDGTDNIQILTASTLTNGVWYHGMCFIDRSGSGQWYINGVASGSAVNVTSAAETITVANVLNIGANDQVQVLDGCIAYLAMWIQDAWLDTHLQATIAQERFNRLIGIHPSKAEGTATPTVALRAAPAYLDKLEGGVRKLYQVGPGWLRIVDRNDSNSKEIKGYLPETAATNKLLQSEDLGTTWAVIDAGDTIGGSVEVPNKTTNTTVGIIGDSTDGPHGVSQATANLTAATWTFSVFAKVGDQSFLTPPSSLSR